MTKPPSSSENTMCLQQYLLLEECETSISCRCLLPLLLTDGLEAALEVFFLFVQTLGPALHVLRNLTHRDGGIFSTSEGLKSNQIFYIFQT